MTKLYQIFKCEVCGNIAEIIHPGGGELVCCGQNMIEQTFKSEGEGAEKHLPVYEKLAEDVCRGGDGIKIKIGKVEHPMTEEHFIEWIGIKTTDGKFGKKFLSPDEEPRAEFHTRSEIKEVFAYCNVHGLWKIVL